MMQEGENEKTRKRENEMCETCGDRGQGLTIAFAIHSLDRSEFSGFFQVDFNDL